MDDPYSLTNGREGHCLPREEWSVHGKVRDERGVADLDTDTVVYERLSHLRSFFCRRST